MFKKRPQPSIAARTSLALLFLLACWLAGLYVFTQSLMPMIEKPRELKPLDAIVVLTGDKGRLENGFSLLNRKAGKKLFISGVYRGLDVRELLNAWKEEDRARFDCCVVLGFEADNTAGNARETAKWMREQKYASLHLVTSNYHMNRALLEFRRVAPELNIFPYPVGPGFEMKDWWRTARSRNLIVREYTKYVATLILSYLPSGAP